MYSILCLLSVLFLTATTFAQSWQWELMAEDYFHPTGFPDWAIADQVVAGDFDGNGVAEFLEPDLTGGLAMAVRDTGSPYTRWVVRACPLPISTWQLSASDLDNDGQDELITLSGSLDSTWARAWDLYSLDSMVWVPRPELDALLDFDVPIVRGDFADFDGDGRLELVAELATLCMYPCIGVFERTDDGVWEERYSDMLDYMRVMSIFHGDFDNDGQLDAMFCCAWDADPPANEVLTLYPLDGEWVHGGGTWGAPLCGGDFDGDGDWEGLGLERGYPGWWMYDSEIGIDLSQYWGPFAGTVVGNLRDDEVSRVFGYHNYEWTEVGNPVFAFNTQWHTANGWQPSTVGIMGQFAMARILTMTLGDMDNDGDLDALASFQTPTGPLAYWRFYENHPQSGSDHFAQPVHFSRFADNPDTTFAFPQLGDITGDGRAELAVIATIDDQDPRVLFFESIGAASDVHFVAHEEWGVGLPLFNVIRLADIDGDGLAELIGHGQDGWESWFRRNGAWDRYDNILPSQIGDYEVNFADADNDGHLDVFAGPDVWLNLSPSAVRERIATQPNDARLLAYPNPFNPSTTLTFAVTNPSHVSLKLLDLTGRTVKVLHDQPTTPGEYRVTVDGADLPSGIYFANLQAAGQSLTTKLFLIR